MTFGLTKGGHRYLVTEGLRCLTCNRFMHGVPSDLKAYCEDCRELAAESVSVLVGLRGDTIEARRHLRNAAHYLGDPENYRLFMVSAEIERETVASVLCRYQGCGPAYVPRGCQ